MDNLIKKSDVLYAERDHMAQGEYYIKHVDAMTREGLHAKSAIAGELAHRDIRIADLEASTYQICEKCLALAEKNDELEAQLNRAFSMLEMNGVPKSRARYVCNGIDVLATRFRKEVSTLEAQLARFEVVAEIKTRTGDYKYMHWYTALQMLKDGTKLFSLKD